MFKFNLWPSDNEKYLMRTNRHELFLDKPDRSFMKGSSSYRGAYAWNNLPNIISGKQIQIPNSHFKTV